MEQDNEFLGKLRDEFYSEAQDSINDCQTVLDAMSSQNWDDFLGILKANLHNLKGASRVAEFPLFSDVVHMMEEINGDSTLTEESFKSIQMKMLSALSFSIEHMIHGEEEKVNNLLSELLETKI